MSGGNTDRVDFGQMKHGEYTLMVSMKRFQGGLFVDIRDHVWDDMANELHPTKRGLTMHLSDFSKLMEILDKVDCYIEGKEEPPLQRRSAQCDSREEI